MRRVRNVLCAVDLSAISTREIEVATEVCAVLDTRLVVVHHREDLAPSRVTPWEWWVGCHRDGGVPDAAERRLADVLKTVDGRVAVEAVLTSGALTAVVGHLVTALPADLLLLGSHGASTANHDSFAERTITRSTTAVLVIHDDDVNGTPLRLRRKSEEPLPVVVVPLDFTASSTAAIEWALTFARAVPLDLHLLHVLPTVATLARAAITGRTPADFVDLALARLHALLPGDFAGRSTCSAEWGDPGAVITAYADRIGPDLMVMGQHMGGLVMRDTTHALLHRAWCPLLVAPPH